ncbi:MAG: thymidylate kinase [Candidatus Latescibacterota bacterium]|jgi:thymidylate kinase
MRVIIVGTEYTGKSTLANALQQWGMECGIRHHMDDHFSVPDQQTLKDPVDQKAMTEVPESIMERFQRFQIAYHVRLINKYEHIILTGFHTEEAVYGQRYYYPGLARPIEHPQSWEQDMPKDTILVLLNTNADVIKQRMQNDPHEYNIVPESDIEACQEAFQEEFRKSLFKKKFQIDTSDLDAKSLLQAFLDGSYGFLGAADLVIRSAK